MLCSMCTQWQQQELCCDGAHLTAFRLQLTAHTFEPFRLGASAFCPSLLSVCPIESQFLEVAVLLLKGVHTLSTAGVH